MDNLQKMIAKLSTEDMPVFAKTSKVIVSISGQDNTSMSDLTWAILKDPSLSSQVLRLANSILYNRDGRKINTISRAVLQLGFKTVKTICLSSMVVENLLKGTKRDRVLQEMVQSFHAAIQARSLASFKGDPGAEEIFVASLLHKIGNIAFWSFGGELADRLEKVIQQKPDIPQDLVEKEVLGFTFKELTSELANEWGLDFAIQNTNANFEYIRLGHSIAIASEHGWSSPKVSNVLNMLSKVLDVTKDDALALVKNNTEEALILANDYGLGPYARFIPVADKSCERPSEIHERVLNTGNAILQIEVLNELSSLLKERQFNLNLFLSSLLEGIYRGVGVDRVILAIVNKEMNHFVGRYGLGWSQDSIERFLVSTKSNISSVFSSVVSSKDSLWVNGDKTKVGRLITDEVKARMGGIHFYIGPVIIRNSVIGLIGADKNISYRELDDKRFCCFRYLLIVANEMLASII